MGPTANKHFRVRTKRNDILVLLLRLLKGVHDSHHVSSHNDILQSGSGKDTVIFLESEADL